MDSYNWRLVGFRYGEIKALPVSLPSSASLLSSGWLPSWPLEAHQ